MSRTAYTRSVLTVTLLATGVGLAACSGGGIGLGSGGDDRISQIQDGFDKIIEAAGSDKAVLAGVGATDVYASILVDGKLAYFNKEFDADEVASYTEGTQPPEHVTADDFATAPFSLAELDLPNVIDPCDKDVLNWSTQTYGVDGEHVLITSKCADHGEDTSVPLNVEIDGEAAEEPDLGDPAALASIADRAIDMTGAPDMLSSVSLGATGNGTLTFSYSAETTGGTTFDGTECTMHYTRSSPLDERDGLPETLACETNADLQMRPPFAAEEFNVETMAKVWAENFTDVPEGEYAQLLFANDLDGELHYEVVRNDGELLLTPSGDPAP